MITVYLKFPDKDAAIASALSIMGALGVPSEGASIPRMGYAQDGTRFDIDLVGGDGIYRKRVGSHTIEVEGFGPMEVPTFEDREGFAVNFLWHGTEETLPDFGATRIFPETPSQVFAV